MQQYSLKLGHDLPDSLVITPQSMDDKDCSISYSRGMQFTTHVSSAK